MRALIANWVILQKRNAFTSVEKVLRRFNDCFCSVISFKQDASERLIPKVEEIVGEELEIAYILVDIFLDVMELFLDLRLISFF